MTTTVRRTVAAVVLTPDAPAVRHIGRPSRNRGGWATLCGWEPERRGVIVRGWAAASARSIKYVGIMDPADTDCDLCTEAYGAGW